LQKLEEIEDGKYKDPNKIDEMPEQPRNFDAIGKVLRIRLVQLRATLNWKPKVQENQDTAEHVKTVKTGDQKVGREVSAVPWRKGAC
jgi:hypothetical protein